MSGPRERFRAGGNQPLATREHARVIPYLIVSAAADDGRRSSHNRQVVMSIHIRIHTCALLALALGAVAARAHTSTIAGAVLSAEEAAPIVGATIRVAGTERGAISNAEGSFRIAGLAAGEYRLSISSVGHAPLDTTVVVAPGDSLFIAVTLEPEAHEEEEVVITGTRTQRSIDDVPVRVEAVPQEEVEEKVLMSPANVAMLLNESTGMRVQVTSPTTSTANVRIQGLPGRYTQILTDGIPNVGGLASGFGLTELPPLNLRQVEIVKGAASALYGADAIAGVVNFITKEPRPEPEATALVNYTSQKGFDVAGYWGESFGDIGVTLMASRSSQPRYDVDGDRFADVSGYERYTVYPKLVYGLSESAKLDVALGYISDDRLGGSVDAPRSAIGAEAPYLEHIRSSRFSGTGRLSVDLGQERALTVAAAGLHLVRDAMYGAQPFDATQQFGYGEAIYATALGRHHALLGVVLSADRFTDRTPGADGGRDYSYIVPGALAQVELDLSDEWSALASGRIDVHSEFGTFASPRASVMFKPSSEVTLRLGGGMGFKAPTIFVEEAEERGFRGVRLDPDVKAERSGSGTFDVNWRTVLGEIGVSVNAAAYVTRLTDALIADPDSLATDLLLLRSADGPTLSRGAELSTKFNYEDFHVSLGYTYLHATRELRGVVEEIPLNPRHSFGGVLMWESEEAEAKVGFEAYWTGLQRLEDHPLRDRSPSYWITGLMAEKGFGPVRLFINFENFLDTRQTRFDPVVIGDPDLGRVRALPVYAPLEGRVINGGIRYVL